MSNASDDLIVNILIQYAPHLAITTVMVKFSNGMWWNADGVHIDWATEIVKSQVDDENRSIRCVAVST